MKKIILVLLIVLQQYAFADWEQCSNGLNNLEITSISFVENKIIVTSNGGGIYETTDEGNFWTKINNGINNKKVLSFDADDSAFVAGTDKSIFFSFDKGKSWTQKSAILNLGYVNNIKINKKRIFGARSIDGNYVSDDYGDTWKPLNITQPLKIFHNDTIVGFDFFGLIISFDNGNTWTYKSHNLANRLFRNIEQHNDKLFAHTDIGLYVSDDYGSSWIFQSNYIKLSNIKIMSYGKYLLLFDAVDGISISSDNGISWECITKNIDTYGNKFTAIQIEDSRIVLGSITGAVYISEDLGKTWVNKNVGFYQDIGPMTKQNNNLIVGIKSGSGLYCSSDLGLTWNYSSHFEKNREVCSLNADKDNIFAGSWSGDIFISSDQGNSWLKKNVTSEYGIVKAICKKGNLLFAGHERKGVYVSTDEGDTWKETEYMWNKSVNALAFSGNRLYAGTEGGIFLTTDDGENWSYKKTWLAAQKIQCLTVNGTDLFAGSSDGGLILSTDNGDTWREINNGLSTKSITSIVVKGNYVFAATLGDGVYLSKDYGLNWRAINSGFTYLFISSLVILDDGIYAACQKNGVYKAKLSDFGITDVKDEIIPENYSFTIQPNPANDQITISLNSTEASEILIYNSLGEKVMSVGTGRDLSAQINISVLPKGMYFIRIGNNAAKFVKM
ncbi:MAG: YCF48-related protein [bacterium]